MDLKNEVQNALNDRMKSSFFGNFVLAWLICNWKICYYLIFIDADLSINERISFAESNINFWDTLGKPVLISFALLIVLPWMTFLSRIVKQWVDVYYQAMKSKYEIKKYQRQLAYEAEQKRLEISRNRHFEIYELEMRQLKFFTDILQGVNELNLGSVTYFPGEEKLIIDGRQIILNLETFGDVLQSIHAKLNINGLSQESKEFFVAKLMNALVHDYFKGQEFLGSQINS